MGNGLLGELVWQKDSVLRFSLDRSDLWDLRPMKNLEDTFVTYHWVYQNWKNDHYDRVQKVLDISNDQRPAPTKIPAGAPEFETRSLGNVTSVRLFVREEICEVHEGLFISSLALQAVACRLRQAFGDQRAKD